MSNLTDNMITCQECEAEFTIEHDNIDAPTFCPFCASLLRVDEDDIDEEDWDE